MHIFNTVSGFMADRFLCHFERSNTYCLFDLLRHIPVNSYGHVGTPGHLTTFFYPGQLNQFLVHILSLVFLSEENNRLI